MKEALLIIDKQPGPSSFDVIRQMRKIIGREKIGHTGSLDPFASGVLVLLLGKATKLSGLLLNADKRYRARVKLGEATDTMDRTGAVIETAAIPTLTEADVEKTLQSFRGEWLQTPPMYSAKKQQGVRLYELARQNISVKREPIPVELYELKLLSFAPPFLEFEVHCSKGTYVRSLATELGVKLGTVAHLAELRRLACGEFRLEESLTLDKLAEDLPGALTQGHRNYARLLRAEGLFRRKTAVGHPLQMPINHGKSLLT